MIRWHALWARHAPPHWTAATDPECGTTAHAAEAPNPADREPKTRQIANAGAKKREPRGKEVVAKGRGEDAGVGERPTVSMGRRLRLGDGLFSSFRAGIIPRSAEAQRGGGAAEERTRRIYSATAALQSEAAEEASARAARHAKAGRGDPVVTVR